MNVQTVDPSHRRNHHVAYLCFLPAVLISLVSGMLNFIPLDTGTAGGIGFLILIPLALLALASIPAGLMLALRHRGDTGIVALAFLTVLFVAEILTEAGSVQFYNLVLSLYGISAALLIASWFLYRRQKYYPVP